MGGPERTRRYPAFERNDTNGLMLARYPCAVGAAMMLCASAANAEPPTAVAIIAIAAIFPVFIVIHSLTLAQQASNVTVDPGQSWVRKCSYLATL